jgi:hypothetical protein
MNRPLIPELFPKNCVTVLGDKNRFSATIMIRQKHMGRASCLKIEQLLSNAFSVFSGASKRPIP